MTEVASACKNFSHYPVDNGIISINGSDSTWSNSGKKAFK